MKALQSDQETDVASAQKLILSIRQSILKTAFEGRLVEQDPRDEPADRLLARLSEPNEARTQARRRRQSRRAAISAE
jgi:type I restriction enzyme S subunit